MFKIICFGCQSLALSICLLSFFIPPAKANSTNVEQPSTSNRTVENGASRMLPLGSPRSTDPRKEEVENRLRKLLGQLSEEDLEDMENCSSFHPSRHTNRIAGGREAKTDEFPPFVWLYLKTSNLSHKKSTCGGTLLTRSIVLTAAHCTKGKELIWVSPTTHYKKRPDLSTFNKAAKICTSKKYNSQKKYDHDIAILRLSSPVEFSKKSNNACLPRRNVSDTDQAYSVGLGITDQNGDHPDNLQVLPVKPEPCKPKDTHPTKVCFKSSDPDHQGDSCRGDSGGPLFSLIDGRMTLVASTSYGPETCQSGKAGISVNANTFNLLEEIFTLINECNNKDAGQ